MLTQKAPSVRILSRMLGLLKFHWPYRLSTLQCPKCVASRIVLPAILQHVRGSFVPRDLPLQQKGIADWLRGRLWLAYCWFMMVCDFETLILEKQN